MKAVIVTDFGGPEVLKYTDMDKPTVGPNQVLIRVQATSVNFADIKSRHGQYHGAGKPPFIPGLDATGIIEEIGSDVQQFKVGQRVIAFPKTGSYAEYIVSDEQLTFLIPESMDLNVAAASPLVSFTSYMLLHDVARISQGETVVIHAAAGGIGTTAIQLARLLGAKTVIGTVGSKEKVETARQAGADHVICNADEDFVLKVNDITGGEGANVILDSIAGEVTEKSLECLAMYGRLVNFGNAGGKAGNIQTNQLHSSCRSVLGFSLGTTRNKKPHLLKGTAEAVMKYLENGQLKITIGSQYKLEDAAKAQELVESRKSTGKVILHV